jgi:hypothetical protein
MEKQKTCAELIHSRYEDRESMIEEMLAYSLGRGLEVAEEKAEFFKESYLEKHGQEPSEEKIEEFIQDYVDNAPYNEMSLMEFPLGFSKKTIVKIELSTGGPADFIEAEIDDDGYINKITYHYQDWFDGAQITVSENSKMSEFVEMFLESIISM